MWYQRHGWSTEHNTESGIPQLHLYAEQLVQQLLVVRFPQAHPALQLQHGLQIRNF